MFHFFVPIGSFWRGKCKEPARRPEADDPKRVVDGGRRSNCPSEWAEQDKKSGTSRFRDLFLAKDFEDLLEGFVACFKYFFLGVARRGCVLSNFPRKGMFGWGRFYFGVGKSSECSEELSGKSPGGTASERSGEIFLLPGEKEGDFGCGFS